MSKTWLLLDCNFLCHRAKHATGGLSYGETPTGVVFGFFLSILPLQQRFRTKHVVFCWDSKTNLRNTKSKQYKANRAIRFKQLPPDEKKVELAFRYQMKKLRREYLPTIGFRNIFCRQGYESDDLIASVCKYSLGDDNAIIVSSDQDLYQLLAANVSIYNPNANKVITLQSFKKQYGISPTQWVDVKAIGGCSGDQVKGIWRIGETTVIKYLRGELKPNSERVLKIEDEEGRRIARDNRVLVELPYPGVRKFRLKKDQLSEKGWREVCKKLGMKSLKTKMPFKGKTR